MEEHILLIEMIALATGLTVIAIETVIIFMLRNHVKALKSNFAETDELINKLKLNIDQHMDHLNDHSHVIETMLQQICDHELGEHEQNLNRLKKRQGKDINSVVTPGKNDRIRSLPIE